MQNHTNIIHILQTSKLYFLLIAMLLVVSGCKQFVSIEEPRGQVLTPNVFSDELAATSAVTSIYSQFQHRSFWPYYISLYCGLSADELTNYSTIPARIELYTNSLNPFTGEFISIWTSAYSYIYQANAALENLDTSQALSNELRRQLRGEALFFRSFLHFYLLNLFGDVPLILTTDYVRNSTSSRTDIQGIYATIISDLMEAKELLSDLYVGPNSISISQERVRPNKWTAAALLARCYLYTSNWGKAQIEATAIINSSHLYRLEENVDDVFLKESREAIWQLMGAGLSTGNTNTYEARNYILTSTPQTGLNNSATLSPQLENSFEESDKRRVNWVGSTSDDGGNTYKFPFKYKAYNTTEVREYSTAFRLAEQYLIRSEANAHLGNISDSMNDLNTIRQRAGLAIIETVDSESLLAAIQQERRVEFFTEWGHRWFDLKRTGTINLVMNYVASQKGTAWLPYKMLWPIPNSDIERNSNLTQNNGYNGAQTN